MAQARTLQFGSDQAVLQQVRTWFDTPIATCVVTAGAEDGSSKRRITVQVVDRLKRPWAGRWLVWIFLSTTAAGDPDGTGNTVAFVSGSVQEEIVVNGEWSILSDADGQVVFDVTVSGTAARFVGSLVLGQPQPSAQLDWS